MDPNPDPARRFCHENIRLRHERNAEREERARLQRIVGYLDAERAQERDLAEQHFGTIAGLRHRCAFLEGVREDFGRERQDSERKLGEVKGELRKLTDEYIARVEELGRERRLSREYEGRLRAREERRAGRGLREQVEDVRAQLKHAQGEIARLDQELRNERRVSSDLRTQRDQERAAATAFHEQVLHACHVYGSSTNTRGTRLTIEAGDPLAQDVDNEGGGGASGDGAGRDAASSDEQRFPTDDGAAFIPPSDDTEDSDDDRGDLDDYDPFSNFEPYTTIDPRYTRQFPSFARPASTFARPFSTSAADNTTNDERTGTPVPDFAAFDADGQPVEYSPPPFAAFTAGSPHVEPPLPHTAAFSAHNQHFAPPQELQSATDRPRCRLVDEWRDRLRRCTRTHPQFNPSSQHAPAVDEEAAPAPGPSRFVPPPGRSAGPRISDDTQAQQGYPGDVTARVLERLGRLEEQGNSTAQCLRRVEDNLGYIMRNIGNVAPATQPPSPAQRGSGSRAEDQGCAISERLLALERVVPDARGSSTQRGSVDISVGENCRPEGISTPDRLIDGTPSPREQALATVAPSVMGEGSGTVIPHGGDDATSVTVETAHHARAPADSSFTPSEVHPKGPRPLPPTPARASSALLHQSPVSSSVTMRDSPHIVQPPRNIDVFIRGTKSNSSGDVKKLRGGDGNQVIGDDVPYASIHPNDAHNGNASPAGTSAGSEDFMADHDVSTAREHDKVDHPFIPFRLTAHENDGALYILLEDVDALVANTSSPTAGTLVDNEVRLTIVLSEVIAMSVRARVHVMHSGDRTRPILRLSVRTRSRLPADAICRTLATAGELKVMRSIVLDMPDEVMDSSAATDCITGFVGGTASPVDLFSEGVSYFGRC
uniref:Uncharacterized protein n=1 Tax=Schizophyllum commune (strain H4-8 / FGSC 9210) TaxID=578458 RepID=D8PYU6_SCHCM